MILFKEMIEKNITTFSNFIKETNKEYEIDELVNQKIKSSINLEDYILELEEILENEKKLSLEKENMFENVKRNRIHFENLLIEKENILLNIHELLNKPDNNSPIDQNDLDVEKNIEKMNKKINEINLNIPENSENIIIDDSLEVKKEEYVQDDMIENIVDENDSYVENNDSFLENNDSFLENENVNTPIEITDEKPYDSDSEDSIYFRTSI
jgi:hypothetical protein